jgi:gliding motility-associated-like protein
LGGSNGEVVVEANGGTPIYSYQWDSNPDDTLNMLTNLLPGTYTVVVTDQNGCSESVSFTVNQPDELEGCVVLEMPNVFSPNGDNTNDLCTPVKVLNIKTYNVQIIDRWGLLMYQGDNFTTGWDGTVHGDPASEGVYFYKVDYTDNYDQSGVLQGFITLMRK